VKKNSQNLIIMALIFLNFFNYFKINNLENSIDRRIQQYENSINNLEREINSIYSNVDTKLKKQASILDNYNIIFGEQLNSDNLTVPVTVSITPKEFSDNLTATLQLNNKNIEMEKKGTSFEVSMGAYIFDDFLLKVVLEQNGIQKVETVEEYNDLQYKYILDMHSGFSGNKSYSSGKLKYKGEINMNFGDFQYNNPEKISIVKDINGAVIGEQEIAFSDPLLITLDESIELGASDKFALYAHVEDKYGINYKYIILAYEIDKNGEPVRSSPEWTNGSIIEISDKNGKVLYSPEYVMKR